MSARDYVMARISAADTSLRTALAELHEAKLLYLEPDDDERGEARLESLELTALLISNAAASIARAMVGHERMDTVQLLALEYDPDDEDAIERQDELDDDEDELDDDEDTEFRDAG